MLKLLWNVASLIAFFNDARNGKRPTSSGVSLMLAIEWLLLVFAIGSAAASSGSGWIHSPMRVAIGGIAVILCSYALVYTAWMVLSWILSTRIKRKQQSSNESP